MIIILQMFILPNYYCRLQHERNKQIYITAKYITMM